MTREEKLQKAHQMFDNRNLLIELKWQKEYFKRGYVSNQEELFNLWIFDECIKALEQEPKPMVEIDLYSVIKQKYIEREVFDRLRAEIKKEIDRDDHADEYCDGYYDGMRKALAIIDKYKAERENKE